MCKIINFTKAKEQKGFIGELLKNRCMILNLSERQLARKSNLDVSLIHNIMDNNQNIFLLSHDNIRKLAETLICKPEFFYSETARDNDYLNVNHYNCIINNKNLLGLNQNKLAVI